jgi:hypothetical protein
MSVPMAARRSVRALLGYGIACTSAACISAGVVVGQSLVQRNYLAAWGWAAAIISGVGYIFAAMTARKLAQ